MPPQTRPIDSRLTRVTKLAETSVKKMSAVELVNLKKQTDFDRKRAKADKQHLEYLKKGGVEIAKQDRALVQAARAVQQTGGGGGAGGAPAGPAAGGGRGRSGAGVQTLASAFGMRRYMGPAALAGIVGGVVGMVTSQVRAAVDAYASTAKAQRDVSGLIGDRGLRRAVIESIPTGFDVNEVLGSLSSFKGVGINKPGDFPLEALRLAQEAQLDKGIAVEDSAQFMGGMRQAGITGFGGGKGSDGLTLLKKIWADGVASGLEKTRVPEHMQNVSKGMQMMGETVAGVVDAGGLSEMLASLGKLGPGFQGGRVTGIMGSIQQTLVQAARLEAPEDVQAFLLRHVGGYGGPGHKRNLVEAQLQMEKGFVPENVKNIIEGVLADGGGGAAAAQMLMKAFPGLSMGKSLQMAAWGESGFQDPAKLDRMVKEAEPETQSYEQQLVDAARAQAALQAEQFTQGGKLYDAISEIQLHISALVSEAIPLLRSIFQVIAEFLASFRDTVRNWFPGGDAVKSAQTQKIWDRFGEQAALTTGVGDIGKLQAIAVEIDEQRTAAEAAIAAAHGLNATMALGSGEPIPGADNIWAAGKAANRDLPGIIATQEDIHDILRQKQYSTAASHVAGSTSGVGEPGWLLTYEALKRAADAQEATATASEKTAKNTESAADVGTVLKHTAAQLGSSPAVEFNDSFGVTPSGW
jgi:hypothetical protein